MSVKSDLFFLNIKQIYPTFAKPSNLEAEIWEEVLEPYDEEAILKGIKSYRKTVDTPFAPTPAKFVEFLYQPQKKKRVEALPLSPSSYLMQQDIKSGRCKHLYPTYERAVEYVLNVKTKDVMSTEAYSKASRGARYHFAVKNGLFADFDKILDLVCVKYEE